MNGSERSRARWIALLWLGAAGAIVGMALSLPDRWWDLKVYQQAMQDLRQGVDLYSAEIVRQQAAHAAGERIFIYVYPPATTFFLRALDLLPSPLSLVLFWLVYGLGFAAQLWAGFQLASPAERPALRWLLPLVMFFPGCLVSDVIQSGNLVIPCYGAVLCSTIYGWRSGRWGWFYLSVLGTSLFKLPLLTLLAIPLLASRAQWLWSVVTGAGGILLFFVQKLLWPRQFAEYLRAVQMQFDFNQDFGYSLAGVLGRALFNLGQPYATASTLFFCVYGALLFLALLYFARLYRTGSIDAAHWMTLLLVGAILLNPRVKEYDTLAVTVPILLLVMRGWRNRSGRRLLIAGGIIAIVTFAASFHEAVSHLDQAGNIVWITAAFLAGAAALAEESRRTTAEQPA